VFGEPHFCYLFSTVFAPIFFSKIGHSSCHPRIFSARNSFLGALFSRSCFILVVDPLPRPVPRGGSVVKFLYPIFRGIGLYDSSSFLTLAEEGSLSDRTSPSLLSIFPFFRCCFDLRDFMFSFFLLSSGTPRKLYLPIYRAPLLRFPVQPCPSPSVNGPPFSICF